MAADIQNLCSRSTRRCNNQTVLLSTTILILMILCLNISFSFKKVSHMSQISISPCKGKFIYAYDLPQDFNDLLLEKICTEMEWVCESFINNGFGQKFEELEYEKLVPKGAWFKTDQYAVEIMFRERMKRYECLTDNPEAANLFYIPFYPGLDLVPNFFNNQMQDRDRTSQRLIGWLLSKPYFGKKQGRDHLLVVGRIATDFLRGEDSNSWGTSLFNLKELENITKAGIERAPWIDSQVGIPYPTGFHPSTPQEMKLWQEKINDYDRNTLVSYSGSPRHSQGEGEWSVARLRDILINQCQNSSLCENLRCDEVDCVKNPNLVTLLYLKSTFCLMPPGDSPTRKAIFDSMLAGCIPVFFSPDSAYNQYLWHLPKNFTSYSVFIPQERLLNSSVPPFDVVGFLDSIPDDVVTNLRQNIVDIVPRIVYAKPGYHNSDPGLQDAFDIIVRNAIIRPSAWK